MLILDEATSALDNESERIVQKSLEELMRGRTTFTIAHRLTTVRNAQVILVLTEKGIVEQGSHAELMARRGVYYDLYKLYTDEEEEERMNVRAYVEADLPRMMLIWNQGVEDGVAFPQLDLLTPETARAFFAAQSFAAVAEENGEVIGLYILHPNNEGRCGHIANASYAVERGARDRGAGEALGEALSENGGGARLSADAV